MDVVVGEEPVEPVRSRDQQPEIWPRKTICHGSGKVVGRARAVGGRHGLFEGRETQTFFLNFVLAGRGQALLSWEASWNHQ